LKLLSLKFDAEKRKSEATKEGVMRLVRNSEPCEPTIKKWASWSSRVLRFGRLKTLLKFVGAPGVGLKLVAATILMQQRWR
jgi:hypothetical protein